MAIYTPRHVPPSRSRKGGTRPGKASELIGVLLRRKKKVSQLRTQTTVTGTQRVWKLKRFSQIATMFAAMACGLLAIFWLSSQLLTRSDIFRLTDIRISGTRILTERQIFDSAGLHRGGSLLRFDSKAAEARIASLPWVEYVEVKTQWPSVVEVTVREHQPFALVVIEGNKEKRVCYIDREGHLFAEVEQGQDLDFPVITGVLSQKDVDADTFVKDSLAEAACKVLLLATRGNAILPVQSVSEVHIDPRQGLIVYLVDRPFPVYFGKDRLQTKYFRLVKVLEQLYADKQVDAVKEIRMDYLDDKVLVTGAEIDG